MQRIEALFGQGCIPGDRFIFRDENVGEAVAGEVDEPEIRIVPVDVGKGGEVSELFPVALRRPLVEAGHRAMEINQVQAPVARQVEELLASAIECGSRWFRGHRFQGAKRALTEVGFAR